MNIKEKIFYILKKIEESSTITLKDKPIKIHQMDIIKFEALSGDISFYEALKILLKLEEEKVVKIIQVAEDFEEVNPPLVELGDERFCFLFKKDENFHDYYNNLENELYPEKNIQKDHEIAYEVTYNEKDRRILINYFLIAKLDFDSTNEWVFSYLFKRPGRRIYKSTLEKARNEEIKKSLHHIVRDIGFTGEFKKVFFSVSEKTILFRNKITFQDLKDLKIEFIRIQEKKR